MASSRPELVGVARQGRSLDAGELHKAPSEPAAEATARARAGGRRRRGGGGRASACAPTTLEGPGDDTYGGRSGEAVASSRPSPGPALSVAWLRRRSAMPPSSRSSSTVGRCSMGFVDRGPTGSKKLSSQAASHVGRCRDGSVTCRSIIAPTDAGAGATESSDGMCNVGSVEEGRVDPQERHGGGRLL